MHPEFVGILLNNNTYRRISSGRIGTESLANHEEAAAMYGLVPCFYHSSYFIGYRNGDRIYARSIRLPSHPHSHPSRHSYAGHLPQPA